MGLYAAVSLYSFHLYTTYIKGKSIPQGFSSGILQKLQYYMAVCLNDPKGQYLVLAILLLPSQPSTVSPLAIALLESIEWVKFSLNPIAEKLNPKLGIQFEGFVMPLFVKFTGDPNLLSRGESNKWFTIVTKAKYTAAHLEVFTGLYLIVYSLLHIETLSVYYFIGNIYSFESPLIVLVTSKVFSSNWMRRYVLILYPILHVLLLFAMLMKLSQAI